MKCKSPYGPKVVIMASGKNSKFADTRYSNVKSIDDAVSFWGLAGDIKFFRRSHNSTLYRLDNFLIRSSTSLMHAKQDQAISQLDLLSPNCRFAKCVFEPVIAGELVFTGWEWIDCTRKADVKDIAEFAAALYGVKPHLKMLWRTVIERIRKYVALIESDPNITDREKSLFQKWFSEAATIWGDVTKGPIGLVHGDLSIENIVVKDDILFGVDLETGGMGPQAWDMVQVLGAPIYGTEENDVEEAFHVYLDSGGKAPRESIEKLIFVMLLAGASWASAFRYMSESHEEQAAVRIEALNGNWRDAPKWTLL